MHGRCSGEILESGRLIAGSIRDPWDWYVSLWGYGCDGRGALHGKLTGRKSLTGHGVRNGLTAGLREMLHDFMRRKGLWKRLYSDVDSHGNFRRWLKYLHAPPGVRAAGGDFARSSISSFAGLYTFRFCRLYLADEEILYNGSISTFEDLQSTYDQGNILQHVIRMENITGGILELLQLSGTPVDDDTEDRIREMKRTNPSSRRKDLSFYYDAETVEIVRRRDALILEKFEYRPPIV